MPRVRGCATSSPVAGRGRRRAPARWLLRGVRSRSPAGVWPAAWAAVTRSRDASGLLPARGLAGLNRRRVPAGSRARRRNASPSGCKNLAGGTTGLDRPLGQPAVRASSRGRWRLGRTALCAGCRRRLRLERRNAFAGGADHADIGEDRDQVARLEERRQQGSVQPATSARTWPCRSRFRRPVHPRPPCPRRACSSVPAGSLQPYCRVSAFPGESPFNQQPFPARSKCARRTSAVPPEVSSPTPRTGTACAASRRT